MGAEVVVWFFAIVCCLVSIFLNFLDKLIMPRSRERAGSGKKPDRLVGECVKSLGLIIYASKCPEPCTSATCPSLKRLAGICVCDRVLSYVR